MGSIALVLIVILMSFIISFLLAAIARRSRKITELEAAVRSKDKRIAQLNESLRYRLAREGAAQQGTGSSYPLVPTSYYPLSSSVAFGTFGYTSSRTIPTSQTNEEP